jgi:hypothetical protein
MTNDLTRLLAILMLTTGLSSPVFAQDSGTGDDAATEAAADEAMAGEEDDDDDDEEEDAGGDSAGAYDAKGKFDYGFAGLLDRDNRSDLAPLTLAAGQPVSGGEYTLKSGGYYRIDINADGSQELALSGGDFFRAVWVNEIVINDIEVRPVGVHSLEFDDAGTATMSFIAIVPGRYTLSVPGSSGDTLQAVFNIQ